MSRPLWPGTDRLPGELEVQEEMHATGDRASIVIGKIRTEVVLRQAERELESVLVAPVSLDQLIGEEPERLSRSVALANFAPNVEEGNSRGSGLRPKRRPSRPIAPSFGSGLQAEYPHHPQVRSVRP
jgi:hypothetical protein